MKLATGIALIVGALPLLIYPIILLAGVMSLAAEPRGDEPPLLMAVATTFLWASLAYPLAYRPFALAAAVFMWKPASERLALGMSFVPLAYLMVLVLLLLAWMGVETSGL